MTSADSRRGGNAAELAPMQPRPPRTGILPTSFEALIMRHVCLVRQIGAQRHSILLPEMIARSWSVVVIGATVARGTMPPARGGERRSAASAFSSPALRRPTDSG